MREGGHYSLFIISCEQSVDGKTSLVYEKKEHRKPIRGVETRFYANNERAGSFSQAGGDEKLIM